MSVTRNINSQNCGIMKEKWLKACLGISAVNVKKNMEFKMSKIKCNLSKEKTSILKRYAEEGYLLCPELELFPANLIKSLSHYPPQLQVADNIIIYIAPYYSIFNNQAEHSLGFVNELSGAISFKKYAYKLYSERILEAYDKTPDDTLGDFAPHLYSNDRRTTARPVINNLFNDDDFIDEFLESPKSKLSLCIKINDDGLNNGVDCFDLEHSLLRTTRSKK